jgi:hypothetical protein
VPYRAGWENFSMRTRTIPVLIAGLLASCSVMRRGTLFGSMPPVYTDTQARLVQARLTERGFPVQLTGVYDERTRDAVTRLQQSRGIDATGEMDAATARALGLPPGDMIPTRGEDWIQDDLQYHVWHDPAGP